MICLSEMLRKWTLSNIPSSDEELILCHTVPHFDALKIYSCGKHCVKRRNCLQQAISPFLTMFSTLYGTYRAPDLRCARANDARLKKKKRTTFQGNAPNGLIFFGCG